MKRLLLLLICFLPLQMLAENPIDDDCTFNGIPLRGKVYIYPSTGFQDFKIALVDNGFADLKVKVRDFCDKQSSCGEWQLVDNPAWADFTIAFVSKGFEDFTIAFSDFAGLN